MCSATQMMLHEDTSPCTRIPGSSELHVHIHTSSPIPERYDRPVLLLRKRMSTCDRDGDKDRDQGAPNMSDSEDANAPLISTPPTETRVQVPCFPSSRVTLAFLQFTGCICLYLMRVNISVAIVCMTEGDTKNASDIINGTTSLSPISPSSVTGTSGYGTISPDITQRPTPAISVFATDDHNGSEFDWDRQLRGWILSSFFVGYLLTQVPSGWLSPQLGGKWPLFTGMAILIVASLVSPTAARISPYFLIMIQVIKGLACGPYYPSIQHLWGYWAPPLERTKLTAFSMSGSAIGSVLSFFFSGLLCDYGFAGGWPSVFYVYALISVVWLVCWGVFVFDTPASHPRISRVEREYIQRSLGPFGNSQLKTPPIPWVGMLTSYPFYAIILTDFAYQWGWYTAQTSLPQYMEDVLKFKISANGALSSIPYFASWAIALIASSIADAMIERRVCSVMVVRKIFNTLGLLVPAIFVVAVGFLDETKPVLAVTFLTIVVGFMGCIRAGHVVNQLDIAPRFGGVIMGVSNSVGTVAGIIAPSATTSLTPNGTQPEWQKVFFLCGVIFFIGWLIFTIFARGEIQPWAVVSDDTDLLEENVPYEKNHFDPDTAYTPSPERPASSGSESSTTSQFENEAYESMDVLKQIQNMQNLEDAQLGSSVI